MLEYDCPDCGKELTGNFGDDVHCDECNKTFATDWDYTSEDSIGCWIMGEIKTPLDNKKCIEQN